MQTIDNETIQPITDRIQSIQTIRLFASLEVVQFHLWRNYLGVIFALPGTDFFLVLVGVMAAFVQAKRIPSSGWRTYIQARYIRLYVTYIPLFVIVLVAKWHDASWNWVLRSFFFIPIVDGLPVIGATWLLSLFILFYFVFSIAFIFRTETILWPVFTLWAISIMSFNWFNWKTGLPTLWSGLLFHERNLEYIIGYLVGIVLRKHLITKFWGRMIFWAGMIGVIGSSIFLNINADSNVRSIFVGLPVALFILGMVSLEQQKVTDFPIRILTKSWLVWLGGTSYVLFLSHGAYLHVWSKILPITPILVPIITVGAIIISAIGYHFWEEPLIKSYKNKSWTMPKLPRLQKKISAP